MFVPRGSQQEAMVALGSVYTRMKGGKNSMAKKAKKAAKKTAKKR
jgi:hypothetical protein